MRRDYFPETYEDAVVFLKAIWFPSAQERVLYIVIERPDLLDVKRRILGNLLGLSRETVTRELRNIEKGEYNERIF